MNNETLKRDLCARLMEGVNISNGNEIVKLTQFNIADALIAYPDFKLLLFHTSALTKPIQIASYNNGEPFVPVVEILKIEHKQWYEEKIGTRYAEIEYKETPNSAKAWFSFMATKDTVLYTLMPWNFPLWIIELMQKWHINYRLSPEQFIEVTDEFNPYK